MTNYEIKEIINVKFINKDTGEVVYEAPYKDFCFACGLSGKTFEQEN